MNFWEAIMLAAGGLFAGGAATFAWSRAPIWRRMTPPQFIPDFEQTIDRTDKVQPALLVAAIVGTIGVVVTRDDVGRIFAIAAAVGFILSLVGSLAYLVPLQRKIIRTPDDQGDAIQEMRLSWFQGNLGRSVVATVAFLCTVAAATVR